MTAKKQTESPKLETDMPLSEKDEVKKAELRTAKATASMKDSVKAELKIRQNK